MKKEYLQESELNIETNTWIGIIFAVCKILGNLELMWNNVKKSVIISD